MRPVRAYQIEKFTMTKKQLALGSFGIIWLLTLALGYHLYASISAQGVPDYPNRAQFRLYILFPCLFVLGNGVLAIYSKKIGAAGAVIAALAQLAALLAFFIVGAGGV